MPHGCARLRQDRLARLPGGRAARSAKLLAGRQQLTVSVPARKIWSELHDGPFDIPAIQISRRHPTSTSAWVDVPTGGASLRTAAYTRDQWNPGPFYGEDRVSIRGLRPAASGRFRYAEVEWDVTSPGDTCSWYGVLEDPVITAGGRIPIQSGGEGDLPAGRTKLSFLFDGSLIAASPNPRFRAALHCDSDPDREGVRPPLQTLALNPLEYEPSHTSFSVHAREPIALVFRRLRLYTSHGAEQNGIPSSFCLKQGSRGARR